MMEARRRDPSAQSFPEITVSIIGQDYMRAGRLCPRRLPSYGEHEHLFPAKPNVRFKGAEKFPRPRAWDLGKRFRRIRTLAKVHDLPDGWAKAYNPARLGRQKYSAGARELREKARHWNGRPFGRNLR